MAANHLLGVLCLAMIICSVVGRPSCSDNEVFNQGNCILMTPQRDAEIKEIANKISDYVDGLEIEYGFFDIRLIKFVIERHNPNEPEDKSVDIQVTINDCTGNDQQAVSSDIIVSAKGKDARNDYQRPSKTDLQNNDAINEEIDKSVAVLGRPELVYLELDDEGEELLRKVQAIRGKSKPLLVYIQSGKQYFFLNV